MNTSTNRYRFFLIILLALVLSGGIWYIHHMSAAGHAPEDGILVQAQEV